MNDQDQKSPPHHPLPVIGHPDKVDQLRQQNAASASDPARHVDTTLVTRYLDAKKTPRQKAIEEKVVDALRLVYDPEIPLNIYDLGLIYGIDVDAETGKVDIRMTLTAPGCPVAGDIVMEVQSRVENIPEIPSADVELVWDPPWGPDRMSEAARLELGI